jgi:hypothetical protein
LLLDKQNSPIGLLDSFYGSGDEVDCVFQPRLIFWLSILSKFLQPFEACAQRDEILCHGQPNRTAAKGFQISR